MPENGWLRVLGVELYTSIPKVIPNPIFHHGSYRYITEESFGDKLPFL
jgi:hypothetical protein